MNAFAACFFLNVLYKSSIINTTNSHQNCLENTGKLRSIYTGIIYYTIIGAKKSRAR
jgi:hypothetical protein